MEAGSGPYDDSAAAGPLSPGTHRGCWLPGGGPGCNAKSSLDPQRLYREQGENIKHHYTQTVDLPEVLLAKLNAMNISEVKLLEGYWVQRQEGGVPSWACMVPCTVTVLTFMASLNKGIHTCVCTGPCE